MNQPDRYAVVGHPIAHSQSPWIHAEFARQTGEALVYERIDLSPEAFVDGVGDFFAEGGCGLNITLPHKRAAFDLAAAGLTERARLAGAVNTLWLSDEGLCGDTTDGAGLVWDLTRLGAPLRDARILVIGAGGAIAGVLGELLAQRPAWLRIVNRNAGRAHELAQTHAELARSQGVLLEGQELNAAGLSGSWDVVLQGSSAALGHDAPLNLNGLALERVQFAYDLVYGSGAAAFMAGCRAAGVPQVHDGLGMLVGQAAESFAIWRGVRPKPEPVLAALRTRLDLA
jgi:shikimate dehydrogenase